MVQTRSRAKKAVENASSENVDLNEDDDSVILSVKKKKRPEIEEITQTQMKKFSKTALNTSNAAIGKKRKRAQLIPTKQKIFNKRRMFQKQKTNIFPEQEISLGILMLKDGIAKAVSEAISIGINEQSAIAMESETFGQEEELSEECEDADEIADPGLEAEAEAEEDDTDAIVCDCPDDNCSCEIDEEDEASEELDANLQRDCLELAYDNFLNPDEMGDEVFGIPENMSEEEAEKLQKELQKVQEHIKDRVPTITRILNSNMTLKDKAHVLEYVMLYNSTPVSEEKLEIRNYIEDYLRMRNVKDLELFERMKRDEPSCEKPSEMMSMREKLYSLNLPETTHKTILQMFYEFENSSPLEPGYRSRKLRLEWLLKFPFGKIKPLPVQIGQNSPEEIQEYLIQVREKLDANVLYQDDVKDQIMTLVASYIANPQHSPSPIALEGPPGVGKTTLIMKGVAEALNLPFFVINAGGTQDAAEFRGMDEVWTNSGPGKLFRTAVQAGCLNFVLLIDEIDKLSNRVNETQNIFTILLDNTMSAVMEDGYFKGVQFDFSKCLKFASFNSREAIGPIMGDRVQKFIIQPYTTQQKVQILKKCILPKYLERENLQGLINFEDEAIRQMISNQKIQEAGLRQLERNSESLVKVLNTLRLISTNSALSEIKISKILKQPKLQDNVVKNIKFPLTVTAEIVNAIWFEPNSDNLQHNSMYL